MEEFKEYELIGQNVINYNETSNETTSESEE